MELAFEIFLVSLFPIVAFGGWCYQKGEERERERHREAAEKRVKDLEDAGYDPTPYHHPYKKDE